MPRESLTVYGSLGGKYRFACWTFNLSWFSLLISVSLNSVTWHQHLRSKLSTISDFLTYDICRLRKGSLVARYFNIFISFFISGAIRCLTIFTAGFTFRHSCGAFTYFCAQVLGIIIEDGVQALYRWMRGVSRDAGRQPSLWARFVGFIWVLLFLTWSTPAFIYPMLAAYSGEERDEVLPLSVLPYLQRVFFA